MNKASRVPWLLYDIFDILLLVVFWNLVIYWVGNIIIAGVDLIQLGINLQ